MPLVHLSTRNTIVNTMDESELATFQPDSPITMVVIEKSAQSQPVMYSLSRLFDKVEPNTFYICSNAGFDNWYERLSERQKNHVAIIYLCIADIAGPVFCQGWEHKVTSIKQAGILECVYVVPPLALPSHLKTPPVLLSNAVNVFVPTAISDESADKLIRGIQSLIEHGENACTHSVTVLSNPYYLCLNQNSSARFSLRPVFGTNITLNLSLLSDTFRLVNAGEIIGWCDHMGLSHLTLENYPTHHLEHYFCADGNALRVTQPLLILWSNIKPETSNESGTWLFVFTEVDKLDTVSF